MNKDKKYTVPYQKQMVIVPKETIIRLLSYWHGGHDDNSDYISASMVRDDWYLESAENTINEKCESLYDYMTTYIRKNVYVEKEK